MQPAPAVSMTARGRGAWAAWQSLLTVLATAVGLGWMLDRAGLPTAWVVGMAGFAAAWSGWLAWEAGRHGAGRLEWDGRIWRHVPGPGRDAAEGALTVAVDLGSWMLLRLEPPHGRTRWIALARSDATAAWPALRRAVLAAPARRPTAAAGQ